MHLQPNNLTLRKEYRDLVAHKTSKERQWYSEMSGFLDGQKLKDIEKKDENEEKLKFKITRKHLLKRAGDPRKEEYEASD